ncbi:MAG: glycosyltransferase family 2 protein [Nanoarchaeota archaeon]
MKCPFVSLAVVNYNGEKILEQCLKSLFRINYPKRSYEVLVVDNFSTDKSLDILKKFSEARLIRNSANMGYVGVNSCLKYAKGKYIFVLNNDLELGKNCVMELVRIMESDLTIGIAAPKFINFFDRNVQSGGTWVSRSFYTGHFKGTKKDKVKEIPYLGIELVRADLVKKFGYIYDSDYFIYGEDLELSLRFRLIGYKTIFVPSALVYHMHSVTAQKVLKARTTYFMERNLMLTFFKVFSVKNTLILFPYVIGMRILGLVKDMLSLKFDSLIARTKAILFIIFNPGMVYRKRKEMQALRKKDDKYILKIFSEKHLFKPKFVA